MALMSSVAAAGASYAPIASSQQAPEASVLDAIVVTGSRIRRVDAETASPIFTIDRGSIEASGATTLGQLVQQMPTVSGAATTTAVNNGGGDGAATVSLRGLGDQRTLVLLNGRRSIGIAGAGAVDVNMFPVNLIERVDVLKEGAGAIYGTDAIGGVVNFITRTDLDGIELSYDYGVSSESDGERQSAGIAWGNQGERGSVVMGFNWNKQKEISANDRAFAREALYLYGGTVYSFGSSRTPNGRIFLPAGSALATQYGCSSITKKDGASGASQNDYRCFTGNDFYNYQPLNLALTPQERGSLFTSANYHVSDNIEAYVELLHNYTTSGFAIAELPFDSRSDDVVIPANNFYNPFGIAFGGASGVNPNALWRMQALGKRQNKVQTTMDQITVGARGNIQGTSWGWDVSGSFATLDQDVHTTGYLLSSRLQAAFGPSFDSGGGNIVCGTPGNVITGCTPINIFDVNNPAQAAALSTVTASYNQNTAFDLKEVGLGFTGDLFDLSAGTVQAAIGVGYAEYFYAFDTDSLTEAQPPDFVNCGISQEACSADTRGEYDVTTLYAEVFVPLLKDVAGAQALNLTLGSSYSDYNTFGDTTNSSVKVEWRPVNDLLVRGTWSEVFRAPTVSDLFAGKAANAPTFNDPCVGLTQAQVNANPNLALACVNVIRDGSFSQPNSQVTGLFSGNPGLSPETGEVVTAGFVYQPSALGGFSVSVDWWQYELDDVITSLDVNSTGTICVAEGASATVSSLPGNPTFCSLIARFPDGQVSIIQQPTLNFGTLETSGVDIGLRYLLQDTTSGSYRFALDLTRINDYDSTPCSLCGTTRVAGTFDRQFGNFAEWRAQASIGWTFDAFSALVSARWIDSLILHDPDGSPGIQPDLSIPSKTYVDLSLGYAFKENLKITLGADNVTNEKPPIMYQNNVINSNTDVSTYDTIGRYYRANIKYKF